MKKAYQVLSISIAIILCFALGGALVYFGMTYKDFKPSSNLTDALDENMSMSDISIAYESASVAVLAESKYKNSSLNSITHLGSAVCVASIGYKTAGGYSVSKGSYFVTNYHTLSYALDSDYTSTFTTEISVVFDDQSYSSYPCSILWSSRELDMAIIFCGEPIDGINYVSMKDRTINCEEKDRLKRDGVFTLGTPLDLTFINTYAEGYVSNSKTMTSQTVKDFYYTGTTGSINGTGNEYAKSSRANQTEVNENVYEDLIMINLDITNGNSGGGLFDSKGNLIGLTTLGLSSESTNGAAMNFAVPIYPATVILDDLIENNENGKNNAVYTLQNLGLTVFDQTIASYTVEIKTEKSAPFYYVEGKILQVTERSKLEFGKSGVYVYSNGNAAWSVIGEGSIITEATNSKGTTKINDRNDLIFFLLNCERGEEISVVYHRNATTSAQSLAKITLA